MVDRINCHNKMGLLTADIVLSNSLDMDMPNYISRAEKLLDEAIKVNYPLDIIRGHFCLHFYTLWTLVKKHIVNVKLI